MNSKYINLFKIPERLFLLTNTRSIVTIKIDFSKYNVIQSRSLRMGRKKSWHQHQHYHHRHNHRAEKRRDADALNGNK